MPCSLPILWTREGKADREMSDMKHVLFFSCWRHPGLPALRHRLPRCGSRRFRRSARAPAETIRLFLAVDGFVRTQCFELLRLGVAGRGGNAPGLIAFANWTANSDTPSSPQGENGLARLHAFDRRPCRGYCGHWHLVDLRDLRTKLDVPDCFLVARQDSNLTKAL